MSAPTRCGSWFSNGSARASWCCSTKRSCPPWAAASPTPGGPAPPAAALAFATRRRFAALARALGVDHLAIIATAAVREASDGRAFAAEIERQCGVPVRIVDGGEEARLSAAGVLAGIRDADGVVGDLGGGRVEVVRGAA